MAAAVAPPPKYHHIVKPPPGSESWICFYPAYINKDKSLAQGRRIQKEKCVPAPTCKEITEVMATTGLQFFVQNKIYCREPSKEPPFWGRLKIEIKRNEAILNPKYKTREDVYEYVAQNIPSLKCRTDPPKAAPAPPPPPPSSSSTSKAAPQEATKKESAKNRGPKRRR